MANIDLHCDEQETRKTYPELKEILSEMLCELESNYLEVILIPQKDPPNIGACNRAAVCINCEWYRQLCSEFESRRKRQYRKFKTKIRRQSIIRILNRLIDGKCCHSKYVEWLINEAEKRKRELEEVPF
jgi:hypothetical protein